MIYAPDTPVLIAVLNNRADWQRICEEGWYRIPVKHAPRRMAADVLAWYQTRAFGEQGGQVRWYAPIDRYTITTRRELLPAEADHPRAAERYWRIEVGPLAELPRPIPAMRFRRVAFIPTRWERLLTAHSLTDLWMGDQALAELCHALEAEGFSIARRRLRERGSQSAQHLTELHVGLHLDQISVTWSTDQEMLFDLAAVVWDVSGCVIQIQEHIASPDR